MLKKLVPHIPIGKITQGARLVRRAFAGYKWHFVLLTALGFAAGLFEAVGVNALIPLFSFFVGDKTSGSNDFVTRTIERVFESVGLGVSLPLLLGLIIVLFFLKAGAQLLFNYVNLRITAEYTENTKQEMFTNTLKASWPYLAKQRLGHLDTVMKVDTEKGAQVLNQLAKLIMVVTGTLMYMLIAFNISETITLMTIGAGIVIFFILKPLFFHVRKAARETAEKYKEVAHLVNESISGIKAIKVDGIEEPVAKRGGILFNRQRYLRIRTGMLNQMATTFIEPAMIVFVAGIVAFAFYQTAFNLGAIAAVVYLIQRTFNYIKQMQGVLNRLNEAIPYLQNMLEYRDEVQKHREDVRKERGEPFAFADTFVFENVSFAYSDNKRPILKNMSFHIKRGALVGIAGPSGVGKTTVFDLVLRLQEPTDGRITVDGMDLRDIDLQDWRRHIAYVPQDSFLLNDTVANNIRFFDENVTESQVRVAARKAHIDELIETKLSTGYNTMLGGDGVQLSGGERQRIAIARALVREPDILLLDEATSALDSQTENEIQKAIEDLRGDITIFVIAHRLSTIEHVDTLLTLKDGEVIVEEK